MSSSPTLLECVLTYEKVNGNHFLIGPLSFEYSFGASPRLILDFNDFEEFNKHFNGCVDISFYRPGRLDKIASRTMHNLSLIENRSQIPLHPPFFDENSYHIFIAVTLSQKEKLENGGYELSLHDLKLFYSLRLFRSKNDRVRLQTLFSKDIKLKCYEKEEEEQKKENIHYLKPLTTLPSYNQPWNEKDDDDNSNISMDDEKFLKDLSSQINNNSDDINLIDPWNEFNWGDFISNE